MGVNALARMAADQFAFRAVGTEGEGRTSRARDASLEAIRGRPRDEVVEILLQRIGDLDGPHRFTLSGARTPSTRSTSSSVM